MEIVGKYKLSAYPKKYKLITQKEFNSEEIWYVFIRGFNDLKGKEDVKFIKENINRIKALADKKRELSILYDSLKMDLLNGWNPFTGKYTIDETQLNVNAKQNNHRSIEICFRKRKASLAEPSYKAYKSACVNVSNSALEAGFGLLKIKDVRRKHVKAIFEHYQTEYKISNFRYNKILGYTRALFSEMIEWEMIEHNPCTGIKSKKVAESQGFKRPTDKEIKIIKEFLEPNYPTFYDFWRTLYHTGIRIKELLKLKVKDVSKDYSFITIQPNLKSENSKTKYIRRIPINEFQKSIFEKIKIFNYDDEFYIFGSPKENKWKELNIENYFTPNKYSLVTDFATHFWRIKIKDGLGLECDLYATKHKSADDKILAGMSEDALKTLFGHTSVLTTNIYIDKTIDLYSKEILEKSKDL